MLIVTAFHHADVAEAIRLYRWMNRLGPLKNHRCLLVADPSTPFDKTIQLRELAEQTFGSTRLLTLKEHVEGWPDAANVAFKFSAVNAGEAFLWLEPDCVPLRASWLDELELEYSSCGKRYMGHLYASENPAIVSPYMSGIAVYPSDCHKELVIPETGKQAWDTLNAHLVSGIAHNTVGIKHFWGQPGLGPTFVEHLTPIKPINAFTLDWLPPDCALFHRNKDGSLIRLLEKKLFNIRHVEPIKVVFNVHNGDIGLAIKHALWLTIMSAGKPWKHEAIVAHDPSCNVVQVNQLQQMLRGCFERVESIVYIRPPIPSYPQCANWAFQSIAIKMMEQDSPWFFFEADAIALKPDWITQLQEEYEKSGKSFMGSQVPHMLHWNGAAIYPSDAPKRMPKAMMAMDQAWDMVAKEEMTPDAHSTPLMFHLWTLLNRKAHPVGGGELPVGITAPELQSWLPREAVFLHRIKDDSVLNLLISGAFRNH